MKLLMHINPQSVLLYFLSLAIQTSLYAQKMRSNDNWPQFRGANASGLANENAKPPVEFNKNENLLWEITLPVGHSSPCIWEDNIIVTGYIKEKKELQTICIDKNNGKTNWIQSIFPDTLDGSHSIGNPVQSTPVVDTAGIYVYFGSYGVLCYDYEGNIQWEHGVPSSKHFWGTSASPIIVGNKVIINRDNQKDGRHLLALNKNTGEVCWKTEMVDYSGEPSSWSTPVHWKNQIIIHRRKGIDAYNISDGMLIWHLPMLTTGTSSPVVSNGMVYICIWHMFGEEENRGDLPRFFDYNTLIGQFDTNEDSLMSKNEFPDDMYIFIRPEIKDLQMSTTSFRFWFDSLMDKNKDGIVDEKEWAEFCEKITGYYQDIGIIALKTDGKGTLGFSDIIWKQSEKISEVPTPLVYQDRVYMIKNGGALTCMNAETGIKFYGERIGASGAYFASPVAANGYIYIPANKGVITVIEAGNELNVIQVNDIGERIYATPAIAGNCIYVRTTNHLYAFGNDKSF